MRPLAPFLLLTMCLAAHAAAPPTVRDLERFGRIEQADRLNVSGIRLYQQGKIGDAVEVFRRVLTLREKIYSRDRFLEGHPLLAMSMNNLAALLNYNGDSEQAERFHRKALAMRQKLYPKERFPRGHTDIATSLNNLGYLLAGRGDFTRAEPFYRQALEMRQAIYSKDRFPRGHPELATSLNNLGLLLKFKGDLPSAEPFLRKGLQMRQALYPKADYPRGHPLIAQSLNNFAGVLEAKHDLVKAEAIYREALAMFQQLYPKAVYPNGHPNLANALLNLGTVLHRRGDLAKAEAAGREALATYQRFYPQKRYPNGHPDIANNLNFLGELAQDRGENAKAEVLYKQAHQMRLRLYPKKTYPNGHLDLAQSLNNLGSLLDAESEYLQAEAYYRQALAMRQALYPRARYPLGHRNLAQSLNNLAISLVLQGEFAQAEALHRQALEMRQKIFPKERFPDGHPSLAVSLTNLGALLKAKHEPVKAENYYRQALAMYQKHYPRDAYPNGHVNLWLILNNLASCLDEQGEWKEAEAYYRQALEMARKLHPAGHPNVAVGLNNLGSGLHSQGKYRKAEQYYRDALAIYEMLYPRDRYPHGHPHLAKTLNNLGSLLAGQVGDYARGEVYYRRSLEMLLAWSANVAATASEARALNQIAALPLSRDFYLSLTRHLPLSDPYSLTWQSKAHLSRVYERRHLAILTSTSDKARGLWNDIQSLRRQRERHLLAPMTPDAAKVRDKQIADLDDKITSREKELLPLLPALERSREMARATPGALRKALPDGAVFIDLIRYVRFDFDPKLPGARGETRTPCYVAFLVMRDKVTRIDLGPAKPIESIVSLWRKAIAENSDTQDRYAAQAHRLIWTPLGKALPPKTNRVFISPDMALCQLPWLALPGKTAKSILLEEYTLAVVPHGPMLLDRLTTTRPRGDSKPAVLVMGGASYDKSPAALEGTVFRGPVENKENRLWPALPGTKKEAQRIGKLLGKRQLLTLSEDKASAANLLAELPRANVAHLATHGFFADRTFRSVLQLDEKLFARGDSFGAELERIGAGARSPMILSGLVCAGANRKDTPNRGIVTADAIVGLDLRKLNLAVLSACETGLGDVAGGEGVYGLQRAFHIAGCRNVVASLWKVDDEATAALMVLFYKGLWDEKKPLSAVEALRQAQLAVYRAPQHVKEWSQGRGPNPKKIVEGPKEKTIKGTKTASARVYAAFVLSGVGD